MCSCRITHLPTGVIRTSQTRSRISSYDNAYKSIAIAINEAVLTQHNAKASSERKDQVGSGMRGDKIRTYRFQDDVVCDHRTGKKGSVKKVLSGNFDLLWN